ncbi:MAG: hypothetical protein IK077_03850 [Thermoguttaceae bacterium]|nr:hypothetical protein [Thermoguttaceae bacterium]
MKNPVFSRVCFIVLACLLGLPTSLTPDVFADEGASSDPPRPLRKDSFFGVHFDYHALMTDPPVGGATTPEMIDALIDIARPDYFEVDSKGHPGVSSYPTKVGNSAGRFVGDPLKVWRDETAKRGVALYAHYSGILDDRAFELHPDWAALDTNGNAIGGRMSLLGPYEDSLLIPQLLEIGRDYSFDGAWVDGDVWGAVVDYSPKVRERFQKETGAEKVPTNPSEPYWKEWRAFQRDLFREYVKRYITSVKKELPDFQFCSNWSFSPHMPEVPFDGVDFISGDICGVDCVNVSRMVSRLFMTQEIPWDLMSWSFYQWQIGSLDPPETRKTSIQLMREAACVISQGGGYQAVFSQAGAGVPPKRDGSVDIEKVKVFASVSDFCRERKEYCFKAKHVPQIAVLLSTQGTYDRWDAANTALFWWDRRQEGIVSCLLENQQAVSVLVTRRLMERMNEFPLIVVAEWDSLETELCEQLVEYVKNGGRVLIVGAQTKALFQQTLDEAKQESGALADGIVPDGMSCEFYALEKGRIATIDQPITDAYRGDPNPVVRDFVGAVVRELFPDPVVTVEGSRDVDVSVMRTVSGDLAVHLVNTSGPHRTAGIIETIEPTDAIDVSVATKAKPKQVVLQPGDRNVDWSWEDGRVQLTIDAVPIHEIIVVSE